MGEDEVSVTPQPTGARAVSRRASKFSRSWENLDCLTTLRHAQQSRGRRTPTELIIYRSRAFVNK
jgi:hypothetical protein